MLTKLYVKESYESHAASLAGSSAHSSLDPGFRPPLRRGSSLLIEDAAATANMFLSYRSSQDLDDEDEEEGGGPRDILEGFSDLSRSPPGGDPLKHFTAALDFKPFDSMEQGSHSSNAVDAASPRADEEGREYHPVSPFATSPFDMELGSPTETGVHTPAGSLANTPSPLEHFKPFPPLRPRKSSSLSNVLDDGSYGTDPPPGDTISNTSNPQVLTAPPQTEACHQPPTLSLTSYLLCHLQQTPEEELCNLLTNIIFSVLWSRSGLEGAEDVVWRERGQVFSVLTKLGSSCQLVRPPDDIKRRSVAEDVQWFAVTDG